MLPKDVLVFTLDSPQLEGRNNFGLGNVVGNLYPILQNNYNVTSYVFSQTLHLSQNHSQSISDAWKDIAFQAFQFLKPDTVVHTHDVPANVSAQFLKTRFRFPWIHSFHIQFSNRYFYEAMTQIRESYRSNMFTNDNYLIQTSEMDFKNTEMELLSMELESYKKADYLVYHSQFMKNEFEDHFGHLVSGKWRDKTSFVLKNGVNPSVFIPIQSEELKKFKKAMFPDLDLLDKEIIVFFGRFAYQKGINFVTSLLYDKYISDNYVVAIIGNQGLKQPRKNKHYNGTLYEFPKVPQVELNKFLNIAKYVVLPSEYEPFGQAGLESIASGAVTILTKNQGYAEFAKHKKNCYLVNPGSLADLVRAIKSLDKNKSLYTDIKNKGRNSILGFAWENVAKEYNELYREVQPLDIDYFLIKKELNVNSNMDVYDNFVLGQDIQDKRVQFLNKNILGEILEIGPNDKMNWKLYEKNKNVKLIHGVDIDNFDNETVFEGIAENPPVKDNSYDTVLCSEVLEHTYHPMQVVHQLMRIAKQRIVLTIPISIADYGHISQPNPDMIKKLLINNKWNIIDEDTIEFNLGYNSPQFKFYMLAVEKSEESNGK